MSTDGYTCQQFNQNNHWCLYYGKSNVDINGVSANEACCMCRGGSRDEGGCAKVHGFSCGKNYLGNAQADAWQTQTADEEECMRQCVGSCTGGYFRKGVNTCYSKQAAPVQNA